MLRQLLVLPSTALAGLPVEVLAKDYTVSYAHSGTMHAYLKSQPPATGKGLFALAEMLIFIGTLVVGLLYALKKRALRWW